MSQTQTQNQNLNSQTQPTPFFKERGGWIYIDLEAIKELIKNIHNSLNSTVPYNLTYHELKRILEEKLKCEYYFDEYPTVRTIIRIGNVEVLSENAMDIIVCHQFTEFEIELRAKRYVMRIYDKNNNVVEYVVPDIYSVDIIGFNFRIDNTL